MQKEYLNATNLNDHQQEFYTDVLAGLRRSTKSLPSKYFYDAKGDVLFQQIMRCPEYYLTRCEEEIFKEKTDRLIEGLFAGKQQVDLIELGAGDASKTQYLLARLLQENYSFTYRPIDISQHIIDELQTVMQAKLPQLVTSPFRGDYFAGLEAMQQGSHAAKVVLFLGANIGNMPRAQAQQFCQQLRSFLRVGDRVLMGFDLMKNPRIVRAAYDDEAGLTAQFNINLLHRMNNELGADFTPEFFEHYCQYDPVGGTCSSYLVSLFDQVVHFPDDNIPFSKDELIHMETSQKYRLEETAQLAEKSGFVALEAISDRKGWFVDVVWEAC